MVALACSGDSGGDGPETEVAEEVTVEVDATEVGPETVTPEETSEEIEDEIEDADEVETIDTSADDLTEVADSGEEVEVVVSGCGDGVLDPDEACDDGDLDDLDGCDRDCQVTRVVAPPEVGDVVINELMINPAALPDPRGEWIELASISDVEVNLSACALIDDGNDRLALSVESGAALGPGELFLLAGDPGVSPDLIYDGMLLDDVSDEVVLVCDGVVVDRVAWSSFGWPIISGRALSLDPTRRDPAAADDVSSWCAATTPYAGGDRGTPGAPNPACPHLDRSVDRCLLLGEATAEGFADTAIHFEVEIEELGLTDLTPGVDASPELVIEVGSAVGPAAGADATDPFAFVWSRAVPREGYEAPVGSRADVWRGQVTAAPGQRRVMARASRDGGASWLYCDRDGSDNGVSGDQLIELTIGQSPCALVTCDSPPISTCAADGVHLDGYGTPGSCVPIGAGAHECHYPTQRSDCGELGRVCEVFGDNAFCGAVPRNPVLGDLVISEIMVRPTAAFGQWVEVTSLAAEPLLLTGCGLTLSTTTDELVWTLEEPTVIGPAADPQPGAEPLTPASGVLVLGRSEIFEENGGAPVTRAWGEAFGEDGLPSTASLTLACGEILDVVIWDFSWPGVSGSAGAAMSLSPLRSEPSGNDTEDSWCVASDSYGEGDRGTPGNRNPNCPGDVEPVEWCAVGGGQVSLRPPAGTQATTVVDVIARTWTGRTFRTDPNPKLVVEAGYAVRGQTASAVETWFGSAPDTSWTASGAGVDPDLDRYQVQLTAPAAGNFDLYARASADGGNTWVVCDATGLVDDDEVGEPVALSPLPSACSPDPCGVVPAPFCKEVAAGSPTEVVASSEPATCRLEGSAAVCSFVETVIEDCSDYGAVCGDGPDGAECTGYPRPPAPGEVVISELVIAAGDMELGEWIELQSVSDVGLDLATCGLRSRNTASLAAPVERWSFGEPLTPLGYFITPHQAVTVARSASSSVNGGAQPLIIFDGISLDNESDWVELVCGEEGSEVAIDRVSWNVDQGWAIPFRSSIQLSGSKLDAVSNDRPASFCAPGVTSPRVRNDVCPGDGVLDDCRVSSSLADLPADQPLAVALLLSDPGVSDARPVTDRAIGSVIEVGIGPADEPPMTSFAWRWVELDPDPDWDDRVGGPAGWDRFAGAITPGAVGSLTLLGRVSLDYGATWTLCGADGIAAGVADGLTIASRSGVCVPSPCTTPPAATCSGSLLRSHDPKGTCTVNEGASCSYSTVTFSCGNYGGCDATAVGCNSNPPPPRNGGDVVISEIMVDSTLPAPDIGEWVELYNSTAVNIDIRGCELIDAEGTSVTIDPGVPKEVITRRHAVLARSDVSSDNGGIPTTVGKPLDLGGLALGNHSGSLTLVCAGVEIDHVAWSYGWPGRTGVAMQLDRSRHDADENDLRANWCDAPWSYGNAANRGSPGSLNPTCP